MIKKKRFDQFYSRFRRVFKMLLAKEIIILKVKVSNTADDGVHDIQIPAFIDAFLRQRGPSGSSTGRVIKARRTRKSTLLSSEYCIIKTNERLRLLDKYLKY